jgi:hypothetical protein
MIRGFLAERDPPQIVLWQRTGFYSIGLTFTTCFFDAIKTRNSAREVSSRADVS